jgi:hypothetical protein
MTTGAVKSGESRVGRWTVPLGWFGAVIGLIIPTLGAATSSADTERRDYRSATAAPAAWQEFAKQLQGRFQQRLAAEDDGARRFQEQMAKHAGETDTAPRTLTVRVWILPNGKLERVEFDGLDADAAVNLRALLVQGDVGVPPPDMLQPLHLRLSLRPKDQPGQEQ